MSIASDVSTVTCRKKKENKQIK